MQTDTNTIETHGPELELLPKLNYYPESSLPRREQRSRPHEQHTYFVDAQNMQRVVNLLSASKQRSQISLKHLREICYRIAITHPDLDFNCSLITAH